MGVAAFDHLMPAMSPAKSQICAVVVTYHPDTGILQRLQQVAPQVAHLVVVDNSGDKATDWLPAHGELPAGTVVIPNPENLGVAAALNQGLAHATRLRCRWLLTLDQDSECRDDLIEVLHAVAENARPTPIVIGGNYFDPQRRRYEVEPDSRMDGCVDRKTVITSGCLVDVDYAHAIGGFREDYFIDQVDHEFSLRVRGLGGRVVISRRPVMTHSVGDQAGAKVPLLGRLPGHTAARKYYIARNSIVTIKRYWQSEPTWCLVRALRLSLGLVLIVTLEGSRYAKFRAFWLGINDAFKGKMGKFDETRL